MVNKIIGHSPLLDRKLYPSKSAGMFDIYSRRWVLDYTSPKGVLIPNLNDWPLEQKEVLLRTLAERATKYEGCSIKTDISSINKFTLLFANSDDFSEAGIDTENLIRWFTSNTNSETKSNLRRIVASAEELGYSAVFEEGVCSIAKNFKDNRIRLHPNRFECSRSFTESERKQLYYQLARETHLGNITDYVRISSTIALITGKRPTQIADSKFMDFSLEEIPLGDKDTRNFIKYNAPVAKQIGQMFRSKFNPIPIVSSFDLWIDLENLRTESIRRINQLLSINLTEEQSLLLPVFLPKEDSDIAQRFEKALNDKLNISSFLHSDRLHINKADMAVTIQKLGKSVTILSEFTGHPLKINAKRFRHTRATNLAFSGASIEDIADALDHSDNRSAAIYVDNLPARAVKIGFQIEATLGVLAKRFAGVKIENSDQVISLYTKQGTKDVGVCGTDIFCTENFPIACYECELFKPNPFGNHSAVQDYVETRVQEAIENGDNRLIENWNTILLAVLERRYVADQQRLQILTEAPEDLSITDEAATYE